MDGLVFVLQTIQSKFSKSNCQTVLSKTMKKHFIPPVIGILALITGIATLPVIPDLALADTPALNTPGAEPIRPKEKRRIAILDFDFSDIGSMSYWSGVFGENGVSRGISDRLTNQLVKDGTFILIERSKIDAVLAEQNLGASGRIEPTTAAQIGRILGVDAVLIGSVTQFGLEDKSQDVSIGSVFGFSGSDKRQNSTVQLTARLVSTATAEILAVAEGVGQAKQKSGGGSFLGIGASSSSDSSSRLLTEAAEQAITQLATQLTASAPKLAAIPAVLPVIDAVIADITGNEVVINKGGKVGLRPGMILSVERVIKEIKDPTTGKVLRVQSQSIGKFQLTEVDAESAVGKILAGSKGAMKVGDRAKAIE